MIANRPISGTKQDIVKRQTALQTAISPPVHPHALSRVNFGPQTAKNNTRVSTDLTRSRCMSHVP